MNFQLEKGNRQSKWDNAIIQHELDEIDLALEQEYTKKNELLSSLLETIQYSDVVVQNFDEITETDEENPEEIQELIRLMSDRYSADFNDKRQEENDIIEGDFEDEDIDDEDFEEEGYDASSKPHDQNESDWLRWGFCDPPEDKEINF